MAVGNEPSASGQLAENALPVHQLVLDGSVTGAPDARVAGNKHNNGQEAIAMAAESPIAATLAEILSTRQLALVTRLQEVLRA